MRVIGLTGGIASGKSTVATMFAEAGIAILDADALYHSLLRPLKGKPSPVGQAIGAAFPGVIESDGNVDRGLLGRLVFGNQLALEKLGSITHPAVAASFAQKISLLKEQAVDLVLYDVPLLFEKGLQTGMQGTIVVWVPRAMQVRRMVARGGLSMEAITSRLDSQLPLSEKRKQATWLIDNSGDLSATRRQVAELISDFGYATGI